jgi:hypothetical protein
MIRVPSSHLAALALLVAASCAVSCKSPPPEAPPAPTAEPVASAAPVAEAAKPRTLPTECEEKGKLCLPPAPFVKRICNDSFPDVALAMLAKGTPWSRGYLRVKSAEAWNASGGVSSADKLVFEEEFVLLAHRDGNTGGMQVSGSGGGYDVLRWDGSCASLMDEEVSLSPSPSPRYAKIPWKNLEDKVQAALLADEKINKVYTDRRKECKGATIGDVSAKCVKLDDLLTKVVFDYVRGGGSVPTPARVP